MSSEVFLSTGGFKNFKANKIIKNYKKENILNIELSGGIHDKNINKSLVNFKKKYPNLKFLIHNYFPPPKKSFVLNLASFDKNIEKLTVNHYMNSIKLCKKLNIDMYSFHAGFRIDPKPKELGKKFKNNKLNERKKTLKKFSDNLKKICIHAKKNKVSILIENNVITEKNLKNFKDDPFLLSHPKEIIEFFKKFPYKIGLLLDVAHLKVSSRTLNFNLKKSHESLKKYIKAYHLSDNNSILDSNDSITYKSWFLKSLKKKLNYYTIEVYKKDLNKLKQQVNLIKKYV